MKGSTVGQEIYRVYMLQCGTESCMVFCFWFLLTTVGVLGGYSFSRHIFVENDRVAGRKKSKRGIS